MKWGVCFVKKVENVFFVKSGPFLNTGCIMYSISILYFTFYLFRGGGAYAPNAPPPAYGPVVHVTSRHIVIIIIIILFEKHIYK